MGIELIALLAVVAQTAAEEDSPGAAVAAFAREHVGQTVGDGECSALAEAAFEAAGADRPKPNGGDPIWGDPVEKRSELKPGDVIQFRDVVFVGRRRAHGTISIYRTEFPHHTAVIDKVLDNGRRLVILHQNAGAAGASEEERRVVRRETLVMADLRAGGTLSFYRPRVARSSE